jgi:GT2 family glycosyltransferase
MVEKPTVSVVIPTLNRETVLTNAVMELLGASSEHMEELIVIDQSDVENRLLPKLKDSRLIYRRADFKNLPRARNVGTRLARGDLILFLDDDDCSLTDIVDAHAQAHLRLGADVVTGPVLRPGEKLVLLSSLSTAEMEELPLGRRQIMNLNAEYAPIFAPGCNSSYRKTLLNDLGGFDENFIGSAVGEDSEMSHRALIAGCRIVYDPKAAIVHLDAQSGGCCNELDWATRAETRILNSHYFHHKIGAKSLALPGLWQIICYEVLNREALRSNSIGTTVRRIAKLVRACWKARSRTSTLLGQSVRQP